MTVPSRRVGSSTAADLCSAAREESNYDYVNARLRSRFRDFLSAETLEEMLESSLPGVENIFLNSSYGPSYRRDFMLASSPLADRLERLVASVAERRFLDIKNWSKGSARVMAAILSIQSDVENGQLFLRSLQSGQLTKVPFLPGYGELTGDFWRHLWSLKGEREKIAESCRYDPTVLSDLLNEAVAVLDSTNRLWDAEWHYLEGVFSWGGRLLAQCQGPGAQVISRYLALLTDLWNIRIWLHEQMGAPSGYEVRFLTGGTLTPELMFSAKRIDVLLRGTFWQKQAQSLNEGSLLSLERFFLRWLMTLRHEDPLGVQVMVSYMARQFCEWRNLMTILAGIQSKLDSAVVRSVLLL